MKKIELRSSSQRAILEALTFYLNNNQDMKPSISRSFCIAKKEMIRGMKKRK